MSPNSGQRPKERASPILAQLKEVYSFMTQNHLDTVEIDEPGRRLRLVRRKAPTAPVMVPIGTGSLPAAGLAQAAQASSLPEGMFAVKSNMVGIFYRAPSPSSPPFVREGDHIKPGQILCVIEAMKVFNELKAEFSGTMTKVLVENGKPVKAGQDIFLIQRN